jgi:hypothetical protein
MNEDTRRVDTQPRFKSRFLYLIVTILAMILVAPHLQGFVGIRLLLDIFFSFIFIAGVYAVSQKKHQLLLAILLAVPMILSFWLKYILVDSYVVIVGRIFGILFMGFAIYHFVQFIYWAEDITKEVISAAIVVYLLLAVMWTFIYSLLELLQPGSFNFASSKIQEVNIIFLYYSFVTITTLGYGDITPLTEKATSLAILEAIIGQIYLVVVVAWLVGMHVSRRSK